MLTPTDVHFLVGLLTMSAEPDGVEVELGSMLTDTAAVEDRDVDITVTARNPDQTVLGVGGIEVKAHGRRLDSGHVEQLACKLNDMPILTRRAIVSASGYFTPAVRKAEKHGIELLELKEWKPKAGDFDHFQSEFVPSVFRRLEWVGRIAVRLNPRNRIAEEDQPRFFENPPIFRSDGTPIPGAPDFDRFLRSMKVKAANELIAKWNPTIVNQGEIRPARVNIIVSDSPFVEVNGRRIQIEELVIEGGIRWREECTETVYRVLTRLGDDRPMAGCCISEIPGWGLCGLIVSNADRSIRFVFVPLAARILKKIRRRPLIAQAGDIVPVL